MDLKQEILGLPFYPHECGGMIECVTKQDALKAMDELSKIVVIAFDIWRVNNGWIRCSNAKHQITYFGVNNRLEKITYTTEQLYELFTQSKEYKELMDQK